MKAYLIEAFLSSYYLVESICGELIHERTRGAVFHEMARLFCISGEAALGKYRAESKSEVYYSVQDQASFERLCRLIEFSRLRGRAQTLSQTDRVIIACKRHAVMKKNEIVKSNMNLTGESILSALSEVAEKGNVDACSIIAFMEYHGICREADRRSAVSRIRKAAGWNNLFACFMGVDYDPDMRMHYLSVLRSVLSVEGKERAFAYVAEELKIKCAIEKDPGAEILEIAFCKGTVKRDTYDRCACDIAHSALLSYEDKAHILHNNNKELLEHTVSVPFSAVKGEVREFDRSVCRSLPVSRDEELRSILRNVTLPASCSPEICKPLFVVSGDEYVCERYCEMLKGGFGGSAVIIDAGKLSSHDFDVRSCNVFLRGMAETGIAETVFLIKNCDMLEPVMLEELCKMLDCGYRKRFDLYHSGVAFDLSSLRFVLFASGQGAHLKALSDLCETVTLQKTSDEEKPAIIKTILESQCRVFGCGEVTMSEECKTRLAGFEAKQIDKIIEGALRSLIYDGKKEMTVDTVEEACASLKIRTSARGFGFNGGVNYA